MKTRKLYDYKSSYSSILKKFYNTVHFSVTSWKLNYGCALKKYSFFFHYEHR